MIFFGSGQDGKYSLFSVSSIDTTINIEDQNIAYCTKTSLNFSTLLLSCFGCIVQSSSLTIRDPVSMNR